MLDCLACSTTSLQAITIPPTRSTECIPGDICTVYASLSTPIETVFQATEAIQRDPDALWRSQLALSEVKRKNIGKKRPCILVRQAIPGIQPAMVYLMGTLGKQPIDSNGVCGVLREFLKPIFPNVGLPGSRHYHTTPAWPHEFQWLIGQAVELNHTKLVDTHWRDFNDELCSQAANLDAIYTIGEDSLSLLNEHCSNTLIVWGIRCKNDPGFAKACEESWRNQDATLSKISLCPVNRASASTTSIPSIRGTSPISRPPSLHTVHEKAGKIHGTHAAGVKKNRSPLENIKVQPHDETDAKQRQRRTSVDSAASKSSKVSAVSKLARKSKWRLATVMYQ